MRKKKKKDQIRSKINAIRHKEIIYITLIVFNLINFAQGLPFGSTHYFPPCSFLFFCLHSLLCVNVLLIAQQSFKPFGEGYF